ncbi:receptor expression-enhancing protein [Elysia marginata]|uniref:Receptor expression-enhancing protein n=1 Tax=Elysia marginata TaxID=1093978 RepID=A0AAV4IKW1_9GAST|nr:receptor expression-enhancing protein [Elysia marginata]
MVSAIISRLVILVFGTLYPAYASYKAVRTKNVKEYVKWMMYWIVFALFCTVETFSDVFLSWLPFYYELKIVFVLWMLSPMTQGSSFLFKKFVHPHLAKREKEIDEMIDQASKQGYTTLVTLGTKGLQTLMKTAIIGQSKLVDHLRRSYSTSDLSNDGHNLVQRHEALNEQEEGEDELDNRLIEDNAELNRRMKSQTTKRGSSSGISLSSVKEEEGENGEHVITETFSIPQNTRRQLSPREDVTRMAQQSRCQSLPPASIKSSLQVTSSCLANSRQFFSELAEVESRVATSKHEHSTSRSGVKKYPLLRSKSQDSSGFARSKFFSNVKETGLKRETFSRVSSGIVDLNNKSANKIIHSKKEEMVTSPMAIPESQNDSCIKIDEETDLSKEAKMVKVLPQNNLLSSGEMIDVDDLKYPDTIVYDEKSLGCFESEVREFCDAGEAAFLTSNKTNVLDCCDDVRLESNVKTLNSKAVLSSSTDDVYSPTNDENIFEAESGLEPFDYCLPEDARSSLNLNTDSKQETFSALSSKTNPEVPLGRALLLASLEEDSEYDLEQFIPHPHSTPNSPALSRDVSLDMMSSSAPGSPLFFLRNQQQKHFSQTAENLRDYTFTASRVPSQLKSVSNHPTASFPFERTLRKSTSMPPMFGKDSVHQRRAWIQTGPVEESEPHLASAAYFRTHRLHTVPGRSLHSKAYLKDSHASGLSKAVSPYDM